VFGEDDAALTLIESYGRDKAFVTQVVQAVLPWVEQLIAWITQVALGHDPKRADSREIPAVFAVQFVGAFVVPDDLPFGTTGQIQVGEKHVSRIRGVTIASIAVVVAIDFPFLQVVRLALATVGRCGRALLVAIARLNAVRIPRVITPSRIVAAEHGSSFRRAAVVTVGVG
jgi:hypothetical protein